MGLKVTACMHSWGKFQTRYKKTKNPAATSEEPGTEAGDCICPLHSTPPKGREDHLSHPSSLTLTTPGPSPHIRNHLPPPHPHRGSKQGREPVVCSCSLCCSRGPNKVSPKSLVWPLIHFYWWWGGQASCWAGERESRDFPTRDSPTRICLAMPETRFPSHVGDLRFHMLQSPSAVTGEPRRCNY